MKRRVALVVATCMLAGAMTVPVSADELKGSGEKLIVGTMANALGLPVHWAQEKGYFEDAGLDVELEIFATGAPINEAMAAGELDVAVSGMASLLFMPLEQECIRILAMVLSQLAANPFM